MPTKTNTATSAKTLKQGMLIIIVACNSKVGNKAESNIIGTQEYHLGLGDTILLLLFWFLTILPGLSLLFISLLQSPFGLTVIEQTIYLFQFLC